MHARTLSAIVAAALLASLSACQRETISAEADPAAGPGRTGTGGGGRDTIRILGSSTVYPFSTAVNAGRHRACRIRAPGRR